MPNFNSRFRSINDASMRHSNTYVAIRDNTTGVLVPYKVEAVTGSTSDPTLELIGFSNDHRSVNMSSPNLIINRPSLGMVNFNCVRTDLTFAVWNETKAQRQVKRSLDLSLININILGLRDIDNYMRTSISKDNNRLNMTSTFFNKVYPTFNAALTKVTEGLLFSCAFSDKFAVAAHRRGGIVIYYKNTIVGYVDDLNYPVLLSQFNYLNEQLQESANAYV